jgi:hypothetical protein
MQPRRRFSEIDSFGHETQANEVGMADAVEDRASPQSSLRRWSLPQLYR